MSYFDNANKNVTRKSFGSKVDKEFKREGVIPVTDRNKDKKDTLAESAARYQDLNKKVNERQLNELKDEKMYNDAMKEGYDNLKDFLIKDLIFEICVESFLVDEDVVNENRDNIIGLVNEQIDNIGGFEGIKRISETTNNLLLKNMLCICEATVKRVGKRNLKEAQGCAKNVDFHLNKIELDEYNCKKNDIGIDTIVGNIKDKVLQVVQDEQKMNADKEMIMNDIQEKVSELNAPVEEAMQFIFENYGIEEDTLFNSIMRSHYKQLIETNSSAIFESFDYKDEAVNTLFEDHEFVMNDIELVDEEFEDEEVEDMFLNECLKLYESYEKGDEEFFNNMENICNKLTESTNGIKTKKEALFYKNLVQNVQKILEDTNELILNETSDGLEGDVHEIEKEIKNADNNMKNSKKVQEEVILCPSCGKEQCTCKQSKESYEVTFESALNIKASLSDFIRKVKGRQFDENVFKKVKDSITDRIKHAKSKKELDAINNNIDNGVKQLEESKQKLPAFRKKIDGSINWLKNTGKKMIEKRKSQINKQATVESYLCKLDDICMELNNVIETHELIKNRVLESLTYEIDGGIVVVPYLQTNDVNLSNLEFAYKTKLICESLKNSLKDVTYLQEVNITERAIELNLHSINETLEAISDRSDMDYKSKMLRISKKYLEKVQELTESSYFEYNDDCSSDSIFSSPEDVDKVFEYVREYSVLESTDKELMELVMAEAIVEYTILETMNTLRLVNYTKDSVRQMSRKNISEPVTEGLFKKKQLVEVEVNYSDWEADCGVWEKGNDIEPLEIINVKLPEKFHAGKTEISEDNWESELLKFIKKELKTKLKKYKVDRIYLH